MTWVFPSPVTMKEATKDEAHLIIIIVEGFLTGCPTWSWEEEGADAPSDVLPYIAIQAFIQFLHFKKQTVTDDFRDAVRMIEWGPLDREFVPNEVLMYFPVAEDGEMMDGF